ncbi:YitT family protein [Pararhodospirillum oryzae]|uniref:Membrane protein n=1 Tax=Pararhodospirillum oryzae TaxID=478448 RepID=A0A512H6R9_9PROT|nr:YitT family protein [Pararhodospirillum oryzae]GEO81159.1 membrane protein [Pararhodospirillum oryzae]
MAHTIRPLLEMWSRDPARHSPVEDLQGLVSGCVISALGLYLLGSVGLLTGGIAGLAFLLRYVTDWKFGILFFLLNLPFYYLAYRRLGLAFCVKTFFAIALTSVLTDLQPRLVTLEWIHPAWATVLGGLLLGYGLLALYRHRASLGGIGILAVFLQERFGWRAGLVQLAFDLTIMGLAFLVAPPDIVLYSVAGAAVLNLFVAINHRSDRYIAQR